MTDKERIEKFILTLMHLDNCMSTLLKMSKNDIMTDSIHQIKATIKEVIDANQDQIDIKL